MNTILACAQADTTHMLFGSASGMTPTTGDYYSWSIGEVIVFNDTLKKGEPISLAQSMQSYTNPPLNECFKVSINSLTESLCTGPDAFTTALSYTILNSKVSTYDTIQWYFAETASANPKDYSKIIGSNSTIAKAFKPYFPGSYRVYIVKDSLKCKAWSEPVTVNLSTSLNNPYIIQDVQPAKNITFNYSAAPGTSVQWYAYVPAPLNKYLLVAGGNTATLKVRYDGDYMAVVSYPNGCKLSANTTVSGYNRPLYRASDVIMDGNTIYIPDETPYPHSSLKIFPNPAINSFTVQFESSSDFISKADLFSNTGLLVKRIDFTEGDYWSKTVIVNAEDLSAGVYFLKVNEGSRQIVQKLVLQK